MSTKRWEVPKRFFKYSESLLALPSTDAEGRARCLLKALRELFKQTELGYQIDDAPLKGFPPPNPAEQPALTFTLGDRQHRLYAPHSQLKGSQKKYFQLVTALHQKTLPPAEPKAAASLRNYRKQREVILTLAQRLHKTKADAKPGIKEASLEEEIIQYQNQLMAELQSEKQANKSLAQQWEASQAFWQRLLQHAQTRLWIQQGWLGLQPKPTRQALSQEFEPQQLVREQANDLSRLLAALQRLQQPPRPRPGQPLPLAAACHQALADLADQGKAAHLSFQLSPSLERAQAPLDPVLLGEALYFLLEAFALVQESSPAPLVVALAAKAHQLEFRCEVAADPPQPWAAPARLEHCLQQPTGLDLNLFVAAALTQAMGASLTLKRQGGSLSCVVSWK